MHCVISFASGSGGHFIGNVVNWLLTQTDFNFSDVGSSHTSHVPYIDFQKMYRNNLGTVESTVNIIQQQYQTSVHVVHWQDLDELGKHFDKVIWIKFDCDDIPTIAQRKITKTPSKILDAYEYNEIKVENKPSYESYLLGLVPSHVQQAIDIARCSWYDLWLDFSPTSISNNFFCVHFKEIVGENNTWIKNLAKFINQHATDDEIDFITSKWNQYQSLQTI